MKEKKEKVDRLYQDLIDRGYDVMINKEEYAKIVGRTVAAVNNYISQGYGIPPYSKLGTKKNSPVLFYLRDVAEFMIAHQIQVA